MSTAIEDEEPRDLIFFDTFSHDKDGVNLDLVQFRATNVRIEEIRIVPLGVRVEAKFPNGDRLGATNPSSFDIHFYVNDLTRPDISTFTEIGTMSYQQNVNTQMIANVKNVTDGLLIRGYFRTLTIAVFGVTLGKTVHVTQEDKRDVDCLDINRRDDDDDDDENILGDKRQEVIDAIMQRLEVRVSGSSDRKNETPFSPDISAKRSLKSPSVSDIDSPTPEKVFKRSPDDSMQATPSFDDLSASNFSDVKTPRSPVAADDISSEAGGTKLSSLEPAQDDLENISPGNSILGDELDEDDVEMGTKAIDDEVEAISSEDDFEDFVCEDSVQVGVDEHPSELTTVVVNDNDDYVDLDPISSDEDEDIAEPVEIDYTDKSDYLKMFDVDSLSLKPIRFFSRLTDTKEEVQVVEKRKFLELASKVTGFKQVIRLREKWVEAMETVVISFSPKSLTDECTEILVDWLVSSLDFEQALQQSQPAMKVRQIKAGIRLLIHAFSSDHDVVQKVISSGTVRLLLELYKKEYMTLPLKLLILKAIDSLAESSYGMKFILSLETERAEGDYGTVYQWLLRETIDTKSSRLLNVIAALLKKCNLYEAISKLKLASSDEEAIEALESVRSMLAISSTFMQQPTRKLPTQTIFEVSACKYGWSTILNWLNDLRILEKFDEIVSLGDERVKSEMVMLFMDIVRCPKGVHFLLQTGESVQLTSSILSSIRGRDKLLYDQLAHYLNATTLLDQVVSIVQQNGRVDASDPEAAVVLHSLFMLLFTWQGRVSITHLLKDDDHLSQVIKIIKSVTNHSGDEEIIFEYFSRILVDFVKFQDEDVLNVIQRHGNDLIELSRMKDKPVFACLSSFIANFITIVPFAYSSSNFKVLSNILKRGLDQDVRKSLVSLPSIPPQILTCLRILNQVCIPHEIETSDNPDIPKQLKYKYAIVQVYSSDCFSHVTCLVDQITGNYLAIPHVSLLTDNLSYYSVLSALKNSTLLISSVIHTLIQTQENSFQDVTVVKSLLRVHCLLSSVSQNHESIEEVRFIKDCVVETISMFCKLPQNGCLGDSDLMKSLWTKVIKEIFSFILSSPVAMISGLDVLSQILPEPVPDLGISCEEKAMVVNLRKLWVVHLTLFKDQIETLGSCLCCCSKGSLRGVVLKILSKIADLSPGTSTMVVQSFMSSLNEVRFKRPQLLGYLWLLVRLIQEWSFKVTLIYLIRLESVKKESNFLHDLLLLSNPHDASILMEIISQLTMTDDRQLLQQLPKEAINSIIIFILIKLETGTLVDSPALSETAFNILSKFCECDLGLYQIRINLKSCGRKVLDSFLDKLMSQFMVRKDILSSSTILQSFISFFTLLIESSEKSGFGLKSAEVRDLLKSPDSAAPDSLDTLIRCSQISKSSADEKSHEVVQRLNSFVELLNRPSSGMVALQPEPKVTKAEPLTALFDKRKLGILRPVNDECSGEVVEVDLVTLGRCVSGIEFNLSKSLREQMGSLEPSKKVLAPTEKKPITQQQQQLVISAKTIASPNRGRGRGTGLRYDPFRTRPPNTSRPPSMHVDDFVALEKDTSVSANRRIKDFQAHRTSSAPSTSYSSLSVDTRHVVQKGASFTHRSSPYLSPRSSTSHWMKKGSNTSSGQSELSKRSQR